MPDTPNWLFGPVWTGLYIVMAIAAWRVWLTRDRQPIALPLSLYAAQMVLNFAWSPLFSACIMSAPRSSTSWRWP